jgi:hypothetical protein
MRDNHHPTSPKGTPIPPPLKSRGHPGSRSVILTLRPSSQQANVTITNGGVMVNVDHIQQNSFLVRAIYFFLIGWWLGLIWTIIGYCLCLTILLLPFGLLMLNRLPAVLTLYRQ